MAMVAKSTATALSKKLTTCISVASFSRYTKFCSNTSALKQDEEFTDIVISGGGMVGAAMACALGNNKLMKGKKIVLLEAGKESTEFNLPEKYSNRTCALSHATKRLLDGFGAWQPIESMRYHSVLRMQVWESCSDSMITFNSPEMTEDLSYIVENDIILASIMDALKNLETEVEVRYQTKAVSFNISGGEDSSEAKLPYVMLTLNDGSVLKTKLLIGADGSNSAVRSACKFHTIGKKYGQSAVCATVKLGGDMPNTTAWQRFLPTGPIALLPLSDTLSSLIWSTTHTNALHLKEIPEDSFVDAINDALWHDREKNAVAGQALDAFKNLVQTIAPASGSDFRQLPPTVVDILEGSRASFPLELIHSSQYVRPRVALIGDAAHRLHPLAGQGVNLGFGDVACLNEVLSKAASNGADPGALTHLLQYETERQRHNVPVMLTIDGLQRLYGTELTPVVLLRSLGLHAVQSLPFLKKFIIDRASV